MPTFGRGSARATAAVPEVSHGVGSPRATAVVPASAFGSGSPLVTAYVPRTAPDKAISISVRRRSLGPIEILVKD